MVVLDAATLFYLLDPDAKAPTDPQTGLPVPNVRARVEYLVSTLEKNREKVVVPTPALSELLVRAGTAGPGYLDISNKSAVFRIADFDQRAAVEALTRSSPGCALFTESSISLCFVSRTSVGDTIGPTTRGRSLMRLAAPTESPERQGRTSGDLRGQPLLRPADPELPLRLPSPPLGTG